MKNSFNHMFNVTKLFYTLVLVVALVLIVPAASYITTALGFNPPTQTPPSGSGALTAGPTGNIGINDPNPTSARLVINAPGQPTIDLDPNPTNNGTIYGLTSAPLVDDEAASKGYVDGKVALAAGGGGGSVILYFKTLSNNPLPAPTCSAALGAGWTEAVIGPGANTIGYGPHYLGLLGYDWYNGGSGGSGGGFPPPAGSLPPGTPGSTSNYVLNTTAIGSDSTCGIDQTTVVPFNSIYNNSITTSFVSMQADACFTDTVTGVTECNRCIICSK